MEDKPEEQHPDEEGLTTAVAPTVTEIKAPKTPADSAKKHKKKKKEHKSSPHPNHEGSSPEGHRADKSPKKKKEKVEGVATSNTSSPLSGSDGSTLKKKSPQAEHKMTVLPTVVRDTSPNISPRGTHSVLPNVVKELSSRAPGAPGAPPSSHSSTSSTPWDSPAPTHFHPHSPPPSHHPPAPPTSKHPPHPPSALPHSHHSEHSEHHEKHSHHSEHHHEDNANSPDSPPALHKVISAGSPDAAPKELASSFGKGSGSAAPARPESEAHPVRPKGMKMKKKTLIPNGANVGSGSVKVIVQGAKGLKAADPNGFSDPYVKIYFDWLETDYLKTTTKYETLDPIWDEKFELHIPGAHADHLRQDLIFRVFDHDKLTDDFLGEVRISPQQLLDLPCEWSAVMECPLQKNPGVRAKGIKGSLFLRLSYSDGYKFAYFGKSLEYSHHAARDRGQSHLVYAIIARLSTPEALVTEGITRLSGSSVAVEELAGIVDKGVLVNWQDVEVSTCVSLLKKYLVSLPDSLFTMDNFNAIEALGLSNQEAATELLSKQITELPELNRKYLKMLFQFFYKVVEHKDVNKMSEGAIARAMGASVVLNSACKNDPAKFMRAMDFVPDLVEFLIIHWDEVFIKKEK